MNMKKGELYFKKRQYLPSKSRWIYIFYLILSDIQWDSLGYYYYAFCYSHIDCKKTKITKGLTSDWELVSESRHKS